MKPFIKTTVRELYNENGEKIDCAPHAEQIVTMAAPKPICPGAMLRKKHV